MYRKCVSCGSTKTYVDKRGRQCWHIVIGKGYFCNKCYMKYHYLPKWNESSPRRIKFLGRRINIGFVVPRTHFCSWCNTFSEMTDMHHLKYLPCMPWACMVELCRKCHSETKDLRKKKD